MSCLAVRIGRGEDGGRWNGTRMEALMDDGLLTLNDEG